MKEILLTQSKVTLVDDEDYNWLSKHKWCAAKSQGRWTAVRGKPLIRMHSVIMNTPSNLEVDHKDGNGLNNQKYNLRNCTRTQNMQNMKGFSGYKGVSYIKRDKYYISNIKYKGKLIYLGCFKVAEEAAKVYNIAATKYFGEFACLNIIPGKEEINEANQ
uniref:Putative homing endonuclease n=1 Tax=viral metagenome TaxID=1070528 RepID=A0A6H1ZW63_9ZZZZ